MPTDTDYLSNPDGAEYPGTESQQSQESPDSVNFEVAVLTKSQANLMNRVKLLTGLLIGSILLSLASMVWAGRQAEPQIIADQPTLEAASEKTPEETDSGINPNVSSTADATPIDELNITTQESARITRRIADLEQQIQELSQTPSENVAAQITETKNQLATVTANLGQAEDEIADLRNLTNALQQAMNQQIEAPVPEPVQAAPDALPDSPAASESP